MAALRFFALAKWLRGKRQLFSPDQYRPRRPAGSDAFAREKPAA
jgi:hypothetical protein